MISSQQLEKKMSIALLVGILLALVLVMIGGIWYLIDNGPAPLNTSLLQNTHYQVTISQIWENAFSLSPIHIIELGLFILIATQLVRVGLLVWFYIRLHDIKFIFFSSFIFLVLLYSLLSGNIQ